MAIQDDVSQDVATRQTVFGHVYHHDLPVEIDVEVHQVAIYGSFEARQSTMCRNWVTTQTTLLTCYSH